MSHRPDEISHRNIIKVIENSESFAKLSPSRAISKLKVLRAKTLSENQKKNLSKSEEFLNFLFSRISKFPNCQTAERGAIQLNHSMQSKL